MGTRSCSTGTPTRADWSEGCVGVRDRANRPAKVSSQRTLTIRTAQVTLLWLLQRARATDTRGCDALVDALTPQHAPSKAKSVCVDEEHTAQISHARAQ